MTIGLGSKRYRTAYRLLCHKTSRHGKSVEHATYPYLEALGMPINPDKLCLRYRIGINLVFGFINIYEFPRFPDISNNINAVLFIPSKVSPATSTEAMCQ
jgi:hypothetical protein